MPWWPLEKRIDIREPTHTVDLCDARTRQHNLVELIQCGDGHVLRLIYELVESLIRERSYHLFVFVRDGRDFCGLVGLLCDSFLFSIRADKVSDFWISEISRRPHPDCRCP